MKTMIFRLLVILAPCFLSVSLFAQKHFHLTVKLPQGIDIEKVEAWLTDGKSERKIKAQSKTVNQLVFASDYYSIYAAVKLQYDVEPPLKAFPNIFFIQEKPALVKIYRSDSAQYPFKNYALENVWDFKEEKKQMDDYMFAERKIVLDYEAQYGEKLFDDPALFRSHLKMMDTLRGKELGYIFSHLNSYYSFYSFRWDVVTSRAVSYDSMLIVFNSFPDKFKYTDEGNYLNKFLQGRQSKEKMPNAIDFTAKDINEKKVTLTGFKGSKYVLLHFWATWCSPCVKELPAVKKLNDEYKSKNLQVISVALPSPEYSDYLTAIKKYHMDWINIYNDEELVDKYGSRGTPRICLIDKNGKFIYDTIDFSDGDAELKELHKILKGSIN